MTAHDLFAMTNPALGAALLWAYLRGAEEAGSGIEFPLMFLPLPILLSSSLSCSFDGTNSRTGFYEWIDRNPQLPVGLADRIGRTTLLSRTALLYAGQVRIITTDPEGRFRTSGTLREAALRRSGDTVRPLFPLSRRLGRWVGEVNSARDVFYALGLTL